MTAIQADSAYAVSDGGNWVAQYVDGLVIISISPESPVDIGDVIDILIPKESQFKWLSEAYADDDDGWEVWVLFREFDVRFNV